jgi:elongation factor Ts
MATVTAQMVKELREMTGAGPMDCKKALEQTDGDLKKAADFLREKGIASAVKKLGKGRTMNEGLIEVYQHNGSRMAVIVEVNCETDFVAKTDKFKLFARNVAKHIAGIKPQYVRREDVPQAVIDAEHLIQVNRAAEEEAEAKAEAEAAGKKWKPKPAEILAKIAEGRMSNFYGEIVLLQQPFFMDESKTIEQLLQEAVSELGEAIQIRRFTRYEIGEGAEATDGE